MSEQLLYKVHFAHTNNSLLSHNTFGALIGSRGHAVRRRPKLRLLHVFVIYSTQLLSHVHHLITWRGAPSVWVLGSGTYICRSTYGISLYVHQRHPVPASCCRAGHWTSSIDRSNDLPHHHEAVYIKIPLFSHFLCSCCKNPPTLCIKMYKYKGHNP